MYLNSIARSVFALALLSGSAMACQNVAASAGCAHAAYVREPHAFDLYKPAAPRVWRGEDGSKWIVSPSGYLVAKPAPRIGKGGWAYYIVFGLVTLADWHSTNRCVNAGTCREGNPLYAAANGSISPVKFFGIKGGSIALSLSSDLYFKPKALRQGKRPSKAVPVVRWIVVGAQAVAVVNNYAR